MTPPLAHLTPPSTPLLRLRQRLRPRTEGRMPPPAAPLLRAVAKMTRVEISRSIFAVSTCGVGPPLSRQLPLARRELRVRALLPPPLSVRPILGRRSLSMSFSTNDRSNHRRGDILDDRRDESENDGQEEQPLVNIERLTGPLNSGIVRVILNRPRKLNALNLDMFESIARAASELRDDGSVRAVILSGEGSAFCSGLDVVR